MYTIYDCPILCVVPSDADQPEKRLSISFTLEVFYQLLILESLSPGVQLSTYGCCLSFSKWWKNSAKDIIMTVILILL